MTKASAFSDEMTVYFHIVYSHNVLIFDLTILLSSAELKVPVFFMQFNNIIIYLYNARTLI